MRSIEIVYGSLAEAREHGPGDVLIRAVEEGWRLLSCPAYCEREGQGVCAFDVAEAPASAGEDQPAAVAAAQPEIDQ